jgi:glucose/arabinose dehydrogenase
VALAATTVNAHDAARSVAHAMSRTTTSLAALLAAAALVSGCGEMASQSVADGTGPRPVLPEPSPSLIPTVHIAPAVGWPQGVSPQPAAGLRTVAFATGLDHPRWLLALPNGDVLVAETNAPARPDDSPGLKGWLGKLLMRRAGADTPSADRITLLRDTDGDGVADVRSVLLDGLHSPFGMALVGNRLYVADTDAVSSFPYTPGALRITAPAEQLVALPAGPINHHWTKNLLASADGRRLYVTIGSNSNVAERGMAVEADRAAIWEVDIRSGEHRVFATGLRNPNGMAWGPKQAALWTVVNERDELGSDLVPDYLTSVRDGGFYGWPYSYHGAHVDTRVTPQRPDLVARALVPDYALGPHTASLGLASGAGNTLSAALAEGMFVGQHGSWNRRPHSGYRVVFVPFADGRPAGPPRDMLSGFLSPDEKLSYGRPVGVALAADGALLVADDVGDVIWRISAG